MLLVASCERPSDFVIKNVRPANQQQITVIDGDTLRVGDETVRIAGMDAAELPPWSKCWSEGALAGASKSVAAQLVEAGNFGASDGGGWRVTNPQGRDERGHLIASLTRDDGEDFADYMGVYGYAARSKQWDWCGAPEDLRDPTGPNLWFPSDNRHEAARD
ncbi:MAG: hypothetical protein SGJ23_13575 [Alphaproteobacteria bacterium]|nr:hypothetical protein [Alphaproteobacteria bacterium]